MNKLRYAHDKHDDRTVVFQAAALAILFHTFLLVAFYIPADDPLQHVLSNKRIRMFSVKSGKVASDLSSILIYGDPTVISKPLHSYPIDEVKEEPDYIDDIVLDKRSSVYKPQVKDFATLNHDKIAIKRSSTLLGSYATIYPFTIDDKTVAYPVVRTNKGEQLKGFSIGDTVDLSKYGTPKSASIYKVRFIGKGVMPRITVMKNSGIVELDRMGARALLRYFGSAFSDVTTKYITITWGAPQ